MNVEDLRITVLSRNHELAERKRQQQQIAEHQQSVTVPKSRKKRKGVQQKRGTPVHQQPAGPAGPALQSCNSEIQYSGGFEDADFKRDPVQNKKLWTPDQQCRKPEQEIKKTQAGECASVEASPRYTILTQAESIAELRSKNEALETQLQALKETLRRNTADHDKAEMERKETIADLEFQLSKRKVTEAEALSRVRQLEGALKQQKESLDARDKCVSQMKEEDNALKAALAQTKSELESRQLQWQEREAESIAKFRSEDEALGTQVQALKETLTRNNAVHDQVEVERNKTIMDLEFQLSEKKVTEADALSKAQQLLEALQQQKESRKDLDKSVAQMNEEGNVLKAALARTQSELGGRQLEWQEERAKLKQSLSDIQHTMEDKEKAMETRMNHLAETIAILTQQMNKPKKRSAWQRFKALFKRP